MAAATKDLGKIVVPTMVAIVRHYTMVAISQQAGTFGENISIISSQTSVFIPFLLQDLFRTAVGTRYQRIIWTR